MYRRNLPHWLPYGKAVFVTWHLLGTFPGNSGGLRDGKAFVEHDRLLDRCERGPTWLRDPQIADAVVSLISALENFDLHAFVVMPNHVHILMTPEVELRFVMRLIKGRSARMANLLLKRSGPFWQDESFDHWVRSPREFDRIRNYIEQNPVKACLVARAEEWPHSSANPKHHRLKPVPPSS